MSDLDRAAVLDALDAAYRNLTAVAGGLGEADLMRPTRCAGWAVADVLYHQVEVRSPSTALIDLSLKKAAYERFGVASYWVVIPDSGMPELIVFELRDGHYAEAARVSGGEPFLAHRPFAVEVVPARLVAGLPPPA